MQKHILRKGMTEHESSNFLMSWRFQPIVSSQSPFPFLHLPEEFIVQTMCLTLQMVSAWSTWPCSSAKDPGPEMEKNIAFLVGLPSWRCERALCMFYSVHEVRDGPWGNSHEHVREEFLAQAFSACVLCVLPLSSSLPHEFTRV